MKLTFKTQSIEVAQTNTNKYRLNDLAKLYQKAQSDKNQTDIAGYVKYLSDFKREQYGIEAVNGGKLRGTYANKLGVFWFAAKLDEEFEVEVFKTFEAAVEGNGEKAVEIAQSALQIAIAKAVQNNREGKLIGKQVSKALQESVNSPREMIDTLATISKSIPKIATMDRKGYWERARAMVSNLQDEHRMGKVFDLSIYAQFEEVMHYCTKQMLRNECKK